MAEPFDLPILRELRHELETAFLHAQDQHDRPAHRAERPRRRLLIPAAAFALAAAAAAVLALTSGIGGGRVSPPPATAAELLRRAGDAAARQQSLMPAADEFFYVHSRATNLSQQQGSGGNPARLVTTDRQVWTSLKRPGRLLTSGGPSPWSDRIPALRHYFIGNERLSRTQLLAFPTDPEAILARLERGYRTGQGASRDGELFTQIVDALRDYPAPPALRAGLYRALARIPDVELIRAVKDRAGGTRPAVARTENGVRREIVVDLTSSELLAERSVLLDPRAAEVPLPRGSLIEDTTYLGRAVTRSTKAP